jgi:hypothetical protein
MTLLYFSIEFHETESLHRILKSIPLNYVCFLFVSFLLLRNLLAVKVTASRISNKKRERHNVSRNFVITFFSPWQTNLWNELQFFNAFQCFLKAAILSSSKRLWIFTSSRFVLLLKICKQRKTWGSFYISKWKKNLPTHEPHTYRLFPHEKKTQKLQ